MLVIDFPHLAAWWNKPSTLIGVLLYIFFDFVLAGAMQVTLKAHPTPLQLSLYTTIYLTMLVFFTLIGICAGDPLLKQNELFSLACAGVTFMTIGLVACVWSNELTPPNRAPLDWRDLRWRVNLTTIPLGPGLLILPALSFMLLLIYHANQPSLLPTVVCILAEVLLCFAIMFFRRPSRLVGRAGNATP